ncbi:MAG: PepSY domain-containing protein [Oscillospiraceae bacterium]|nr:PepSY domain-containing protein [Oscillospiraceae bacterium]
MKNRKKMILTVSLLTALALFAGCSTAAAVSPETIPAVTAAPAFLDLGQVKAIAYDHAGVAESAATDRSYDFDDGRYEIEFDHGGWEYDYHIAPDGTILSAEKTPEPTRPAQTKPVQTQPVETKPVETQPAETKPAASTRITSEEAKAIAYAHAGVKESDAYDRSWERDDGRYEVEFSHDGWDYDYTVSYEGKVLRSHREPDDDRPKTTKPAETKSAEQKPAETQPKSGRISAEKALSIALNHAGVTDVRDKDVEWDDGRWEVSFDSGRTEYDYKISADGTILRWEKETDD